MRRAPSENDSYSTNVFSNDAWSSANSNEYSPLKTEETDDLSKYAATSLPDSFLSSQRVPRYSPSPHSPQYEPAPEQTNSQSNPFDHSAYDGRPSEPLRQNARYEEMPSALRKRRLGGDSFVSDYNPTVPPAQTLAAPQAPAAPAAPVAYTAPPAPQAPQAYTPAPSPAAYEEVAYRPATPQIPPTQSAPTTPTYTANPPAPQEAQPDLSQDLNDTVENEIPLSDFEKDFIEEKIDQSLNQQVIDLTQDVIETKANPIPPSIFNTGPVGFVEPVTYGSNDSIFGTQHLDISDSDRLYKDERPVRETIQIDAEFVKNLFSKVSIKVVVIGLVAVLLLVAAYLVVRPASTSSPNTPAESSESFMGSEKTVVPSSEQVVAPDPTVSVPDPSAGAPVVNPNPESGAVVTYDENGNAVYSSPTNQNFNGL